MLFWRKLLRTLGVDVRLSIIFAERASCVSMSGTLGSILPMWLCMVIVICQLASEKCNRFSFVLLVWLLIYNRSGLRIQAKQIGDSISEEREVGRVGKVSGKGRKKVRKRPEGRKNERFQGGKHDLLEIASTEEVWFFKIFLPSPWTLSPVAGARMFSERNQVEKMRGVISSCVEL